MPVFVLLWIPMLETLMYTLLELDSVCIGASRSCRVSFVSNILACLEMCLSLGFKSRNLKLCLMGFWNMPILALLQISTRAFHAWNSTKLDSAWQRDRSRPCHFSFISHFLKPRRVFGVGILETCTKRFLTLQDFAFIDVLKAQFNLIHMRRFFFSPLFHAFGCFSPSRNPPLRLKLRVNMSVPAIFRISTRETHAFTILKLDSAWVGDSYSIMWCFFCLAHPRAFSEMSQSPFGS